MKTQAKNFFEDLPEIKIDPSMPDFSNHPFFVEKKRRAIEFLKKHPIPEELLKSKEGAQK